MPEVRLQKALADAGIASRRAAEELIATGRVRVDGAVAVIGQRVDPATQRIDVDGHPLPTSGRRVHLALAKPVGYTSTVADRHASRTVLDLVPHALVAEAGRLFPVGRLDRDSEGLLLLTNDGPWAQRALHPRYGVEREYAVGLQVALSRDQAERLLEGVSLEEGLAAAAELRPATQAETAQLEAAMGRSPSTLSWYRVVIAQGWKRQVRRMFAAVDAPVARLVRVRIGPVELGRLRSGSLRRLNDREVAALVAGASGAGGLVVAIDGPASSGKSSVGAAAAETLGYRFCDTGLFYRAVAWLAVERGVPLDDGDRLAALAAEVELPADDRGRHARVWAAGREVTADVAEAGIDASASRVAVQPALRRALLARQRELAAEGGIVMAGRDIGTVVLPDADLKLYVDASAEVRAQRRAEQRGLAPDDPERTRILADLRGRDATDAGRETAPLRVADDAVVVETDDLTFTQTVDRVVAAVRARETRPGH